jgi:glycosyltransferase involved in cell wall biosynthesis
MRRNTSSIAAGSTPRSILTASSAVRRSSSRSRRAPRVLGQSTSAPPRYPTERSVARRAALSFSAGQRTGIGAETDADRRLQTIVRTAFVSTYPPRQCGIATFTGDLSRVTPDREIVALHPAEPVGKYAFEVHHRIRRDVPDDYARTAISLERCADVASIQFADGIWGGDEGESVLDFVRELRLPALATLHNLQTNPSPHAREIVLELVDSVRAAVVMCETAATLLRDGYGIDADRVEVIPYGVPDLPIMPADSMKPNVGLEHRNVLMSFGLLDPDKGYELVIDALPEIIAAHPKTTYVIVGATHPDVRLRDGEAYRTALAARAAKHKVTDNVKFVPEFVGRVELARWLQATDVFISPTANLDAMVSGPLTYAMAAGRSIVSTPYAYANELLADGRGVLADPDPKSIAAAVNRLLADPAARLEIGALAHERTRDMVWTQVGAAYQALFARVAADVPLVKRGRSLSVSTPR